MYKKLLWYKYTMLNVSLEDKYLIRKGRIFVNGTQVLVKLPLIQKALDKKEI